MSDQPTLETITPTEFVGLQLKAARMERAVAEYAKLRVQLKDTEARAEAASRLGTGYMAAAETAEAAITRVQDLADRWAKAGPPPLGTSLARWWDKRLVELNTALDEPKEHCGAGSTSPNALGNERCTLPAGHDGRHYEGNLTWPRDVPPPCPAGCGATNQCPIHAQQPKEH